MTSSTLLEASMVRCREDALGRTMPTYRYPGSSSGRKESGMPRAIHTAATETTSRKTRANPDLRMRKPDVATYLLLVRPKARLNQEKKYPRGPRAGFLGLSS